MLPVPVSAPAVDLMGHAQFSEANFAQANFFQLTLCMDHPIKGLNSTSSVWLSLLFAFRVKPIHPTLGQIQSELLFPNGWLVKGCPLLSVASVQPPFCFAQQEEPLWFCKIGTYHQINLNMDLLSIPHRILQTVVSGPLVWGLPISC